MNFLKFVSTAVVLLVLIISSSCTTDKKENSEEEPALNLEFQKVHEFSITNPEVIPSPRNFHILSDGSLVIVDYGLNTINHFNSAGDLMSTKGGQGQGPGEYQRIGAVSIRDDGKVAVADMSSASLTVSDVYSEERHQATIEPGWNMALQWAGDQLIYSSHPFRIMGGNSGDIIMTTFNQTLENSDQLMRLELQRDDPPEEQISCMFCRFWFSDDLTFYTTPNDERYLIYFVNPETGESFKVNREEIGPVEYSDQELEQIAEQRREASSRVGIELESSDLPRFKRIIVDMFIDHKERLWVQRHSTDESSTVYDLFNQDREYLGSVTPPEDVRRILSVSGDRVLFSLWDPNHNPDTWSAAVYKLVEN